MAFDFTDIKARTGKLAGLSSFSSVASEGSSQIVRIPMDLIEPFAEGAHPFREYTPEKLDELAESIKINGLLQPIIVFRKTDGRYMIISGHNRYRACLKNCADSIEAVVRNELTMIQSRLMMVDTNLEQRHKLSVKERALAYKIKHECLKEFGVTNPTASIARENGENRRSVQRYLAISRLTPALIDMADNERIKLNTAVTLSSLDKQTQDNLAEYLETTDNRQITERQAAILKNSSADKSLSLSEIAELFNDSLTKSKRNSSFVRICYDDISASLDGIPEKETGKLIRWLLSVSPEKIEEYRKINGLVGTQNISDELSEENYYAEL